MSKVLVGCCGFPVNRKTYMSHLRAVEIQRTFYSLPQVRTAQRWRGEAPRDFHYTMKAWQLITHPASSPTYRRLREPLSGPRDAYGYFRPTPEVWEAWERTREIGEVLDAEWIIFQCPRSFTPTEEHVTNLRAFFRRIERGPWRLGWEPRGAWPDDLVRELCRELDLIHVVDPFVGLPVTENIAYFRLHGIGGYRYRYTPEDLERVWSWAREYEEAWVMFNNVSMWDDARAFLALLERER